MIDIVMTRWMRLPLWGKWITSIVAVFFVSSISQSIDEHHFLQALFQNFFAITLHWGLIALAFGGAIWAGMKIADRTGNYWLGWAVGLVIVVVMAGPVNDFFESLPGVGKRLSALRDSDCYTEWDGRSNPMVCD
jgi:fructose-specific phosphotransferase system IIC component